MIIIANPNKKAVLYLRYSSNNQTEQSIEGQRRICQDYARREGIQIIREYVDRATSASHDVQKRTHFLDMIKDAKLEDFDYVIVYKLDRFSRDRYDFAHYKAKLKEHGIKVLSATENLTDSPESVIMESLLEGMAEYYSKELSQKVQRGMNESAQKRQVLSGAVPLGLKIVNKKYVPDSETRWIIERIFTEYLTGSSLKDIALALNDAGIRSSRNKKFGPQTIARILHNEKYAGIYKYKDIVYDETAIDPIISKEDFERVQKKLKANGKNMRKKTNDPESEPLLKGKIFCGLCGAAMIPITGTSGNGKRHQYYKCDSKRRRSDCTKRNEQKELIESLVIEDAAKLLTDEYIGKIIDVVMAAYERQEVGAEATMLEKRSEECAKEIDRYVNLIGKGIQSEAIIAKLTETEAHKKEIDARLLELKVSQDLLSREHILFYLNKIRMDPERPEFAKTIINAFVERVEVFDDEDDPGKRGYIRIYYRLSDKPRDCSVFVAKPQPYENRSAIADSLYACKSQVFFFTLLVLTARRFLFFGFRFPIFPGFLSVNFHEL